MVSQADSENSEMERQDQPNDGSARRPQTRTAAGWLHCPQCGGTQIRKRSTPFLFNVGACIVLPPLIVPVSSMESAVLAMVWFVAVSAAFLALPTTTGIALGGRHRCRSCGHRFAFAGDGGLQADGLGFPWPWSVLNTILAFLLCVVGSRVLRAQAGVGGPPDLIGDLSIALRLGLVLWGSLAWQLVLHSLLRQRIGNQLAWAVLFILPGVLGGSAVLHAVPPPAVRARALLSRTQMGSLPPSATDIKVYVWSSGLSGEDFLRFAADPNDIERFIADSPILQGKEPDRFSAQRMRLKRPEDYYQTDWRYFEDGNEYFIPESNYPSWYKQEIQGPARRYLIKPPGYHYGGEVLIDDVEHVVYVYACVS